MSRILVLNNYDFKSLTEDPPQSPDHFFYGIKHLSRSGHSVSVASRESKPILRIFEEVNRRSRLNIPLGDLSQQWNALPELRSAELIYTPCDSVAQSLCYLRAFGVIRHPIVCLAHHPPLRGRARLLRRPWVKFGLGGVSAFPSLSKVVAEQINALAPGRQLSSALAWGPDLDYYPPYNPPQRGVISAGRTGRDFLTFGQAASRTSCLTTIICPSSYVTPEFSQFALNVTVLSNPNQLHFKYEELIRRYSHNRAIAIPMVATSGLCGLTSLLDALGMGRAVIMTRNPFIDIDIETERIGFVIAPGDRDGWQKAIQFTEDHPDDTAEMGYRARRLAEDRCNSRLFALSISKIIERTLCAV